VSADGGKSWSAAKLGAPHPDGGWQEFEAVLAASEGPLAVLSRATDEAGDVQPLQADWNPGGYLRNCADSVSVSVEKGADPAAEELLRARCLICHTRGIVAGPRLSREALDKVLSKMKRFGAVLTDPEQRALAEYLSGLPPAEGPPAGPPPL